LIETTLDKLRQSIVNGRTSPKRVHCMIMTQYFVDHFLGPLWLLGCTYIWVWFKVQVVSW